MIRRSGQLGELLTLSCMRARRPSEEVSREPKSRFQGGGFPQRRSWPQNHRVLVAGGVGGWAMVGDWASREQ